MVEFASKKNEAGFRTDQSMNRKFLQLIIFLSFLALIVFGYSNYQANERTGDDLRLWFFDVGQGDSILIDTPTHEQILVDGGPDETVLQRLSQALPLTDKEINLVIVTHDDADHLSGINQVLQHYKVDDIWVSGAIDTTKTYQTFIQLVKDKNIPIENVAAGKTISFGGLTGITLYPFQNYAGAFPSAQNDAMVVTYWQYGQETFLLSGDVQSENELEMMRHNVVRPAKILKIAHHGSTTSSSESFLKAVKPDFAVISVGANNKYGHPAPSIIERLKSLNIPVLRTDQNGTIRFSIWPDHLDYKTNL